MSTMTRRTRKTKTETTSHPSVAHVACACLQPFAVRRRRVSHAALVLFGCLCAVSAQTASHPAKTPNPSKPYAIVFGTAWDANSHPVFGVHVHLHRVGDKKARWEAFSDHHGEFSFHVPPGKADYELTGDLKSGKLHKIIGLPPKEPVAVHIEFDERIDTGLHLTKQ